MKRPDFAKAVSGTGVRRRAGRRFVFEPWKTKEGRNDISAFSFKSGANKRIGDRQKS